MEKFFSNCWSAFISYLLERNYDIALFKAVYPPFVITVPAAVVPAIEEFAILSMASS